MFFSCRHGATGNVEEESYIKRIIPLCSVTECEGGAQVASLHWPNVGI